MADDQTKTGGQQKDITLRDVVVHMQNMQQQLSADMKSMEKRLSTRIDGNSADIQSLKASVQKLEKNMNERFDALQEDLFATSKDTVTIRRHVGMAVPDDD